MKEVKIVRIPVRCPHCQSGHVIKGGKTKAGTQRYKRVFVALREGSCDGHAISRALQRLGLPKWYKRTTSGV